jgi:tagatose-6-phosphate ketose/aldose isomerase
MRSPRSSFDLLAKIAVADFRRVVFLGSGPHYAAAREAALKMLELTSGRVTTLCETYLGFWHGPMSYVQDDTLIVCDLSCDSTTRAYELDLLRELDRKKLGLFKVIVGENVPDSAAREGDEVIECRGLTELGDEETPAVYVVVVQLLAFFVALKRGFSRIHRQKAELSTVWWRNFPSTLLHKSRRKETLGAGRMGLEACINP